MSTSSPLFTPYTLGGLVLPNRTVMAPMTRSRAGEGNVVAPITATYYAQRASAGLIVTEGTQVSPQGQGYISTPGIYNEAQRDGWRVVTDAVHAAGGRIYAQLWHVGRVSHVSFQPDGAAPLAPSAITAPGMAFTSQGPAPLSPPRALEVHEIAEVVAQFAHAAQIAKDAGFDGVELHGANGYLIDQFLRDGSNHRTDAYGGSIPNRLRFLLEVFDAVAQVFPAERVGVRFSPFNPYNGMSDSDPVAVFTAASAALAARGAGYVHLIDPAGSEQPLAPAIRAVFPGPLIVNGGFGADSANAAIEAGYADLVAFGVPFLANPDLPRRLAEGAPLNEPDRGTFYGGGEHGYTDYPALG